MCRNFNEDKRDKNMKNIWAQSAPVGRNYNTIFSYWIILYNAAPHI